MPTRRCILAGGTDDLRLNGSAPGKDLIDISALGLDDIFVQDGKLYIGARCTFNQVIESDLVPEFIKEAAHFCASFTKRNSATVGGNVGLRRSDSYLAAALTAADAVLQSITPHGEEMKPIGEYLQSKCMRLIEYVVLDADRTGWVKRFTNTASSHAAVTAAVSGDIYALSVSGSDFAYGTTPDLADSWNSLTIFPAVLNIRSTWQRSYLHWGGRAMEVKCRLNGEEYYPPW